MYVWFNAVTICIDLLFFSIGTKDRPTNITYLPNGLFGTLSFSSIDISDTLVNRIDEEVFENSYSTLHTLKVVKSKLRTFPGTILPQFQELTGNSLASYYLLVQFILCFYTYMVLYKFFNNIL